MLIREKIGHLPKCVKNFLVYKMNVRNSSDGTIIGYKNDLELLMKFLKYKFGMFEYSENFHIGSGVVDIDISDIDDTFFQLIIQNDLYDFLLFCEIHRFNSSTTQLRKVSCIRGFFKYLYEQRIIDTDPAVTLQGFTVEKKTLIYLADDEIATLIKTVSRRNKTRNIAIVSLIVSTGIKLTEICNIDITDISGNYISIIGKNNKRRIIEMNDICRKHIDEYLRDRNNIEGEIAKGSEYALFLSERRKRISKRTIEEIIATAINKTDLNKKYSAQKIRHTAAVNLYNNGASVEEIQEFLGHKRLITTIRFVESIKIKGTKEINHHGKD